MTTAEKLVLMKAELKTLIEKRNAAREAHDEPLFRWYAERAIKLQEEIREAEWGVH